MRRVGEEKDFGQAREILRTLLDLGQALLEYGGEVNRVEDTLERMGRAYGAKGMNVFVITTSMVVTMLHKDGEEITLTRRIRKPIGNDFTKLEQLNALSRKCCQEPMKVAELQEKIQEIKNQPYSFKKYLIGAMLSAGSFSVFFGGSLLDGLFSMLFAIFICLLQRYVQKYCTNMAVFQLFCSFVIGIGISVVTKCVPFLHLDYIMIGDIMLLIPGLAMTNSVRDILVGDTISGFLRLAESLLWAGALACGFMTAIWLSFSL